MIMCDACIMLTQQYFGLTRFFVTCFTSEFSMPTKKAVVYSCGMTT